MHHIRGQEHPEREKGHEGKPGRGRREPREDRRRRFAAVPRKGLRRDRRRGSHEGSRADTRRLLRPFRIEGSPRRGGEQPRGRTRPQALEEDRGWRRRRRIRGSREELSFGGAVLVAWFELSFRRARERRLASAQVGATRLRRELLKGYRHPGP